MSIKIIYRTYLISSSMGTAFGIASVSGSSSVLSRIRFTARSSLDFSRSRFRFETLRFSSSAFKRFWLNFFVLFFALIPITKIKAKKKTSQRVFGWTRVHKNALNFKVETLSTHRRHKAPQIILPRFNQPLIRHELILIEFE